MWYSIHVLGHSLSLNVTLFTILLPHNIFKLLKAANEIIYIHELPLFASNLWLSCCAFAPRYMYIMPMIVSNCQHCDEQQFRNVMCSVYILHHFFSSKVDLCIRELLDHILV